jgi:tetratricopeptide (TPR) repeat protein
MSAPQPPVSGAELQSRLERALTEATTREGAGDLAGAIAALEAAAAEGVDALGLFHYAFGALQARVGDLDAAVTSFERAVAIEPDIPEYRGNLGAALLRGAYRPDAGRPEVTDAPRLARALELLEGAVRDRPQTADVYSNCGLAQLLDGRPADAIASCERALALEPESLAALYGKAIAHHVAGDDEACLAALDACLRIDPTFAPALQSRQSTLGRLGRDS